jgi:hypothetical protein
VVKARNLRVSGGAEAPAEMGKAAEERNPEKGEGRDSTDDERCRGLRKPARRIRAARPWHIGVRAVRSASYLKGA